MDEMTVVDIVSEWLESQGYGGLYNDADADGHGCGCILGDLMLCGGDQSTCEPAYAFECWRCAWGGVCGKRGEGCEWMTSTDKDFCEPDYMVAAPAASLAAQSAALPACAPLTVGEMLGIKFLSGDDIHSSAHAQIGIGEAPEFALKVEAGEVFISVDQMAELIAKAIKDSTPKPKPAALAMQPPAKEVCQNTAKNNSASRMLKEDRTAEYMRYLGYGA